MRTRFPWPLRLLGEPRMAVIYVPEEAEQSVRARAAQLFPEAIVTEHL
ncbi:MAG TPA: hypothetical protein VHD36_06830 [Pirellulales bacterium]|nr:hypothetical protein [Pirellulales bacterium]